MIQRKNPVTGSTSYTPRLLLRQPEAADAAVIRWLCDDLRVARGLPDLPCPRTLADAEQWIAAVHDEMASGASHTFLIERRECPEVLGAISLRLGQDPAYAGSPGSPPGTRGAAPLPRV